MGLQSKREELLAAWRALSGGQIEEGWRTIPIGDGSLFRAGRRFPGNEEALLVGFGIKYPPRADRLPEGRGFTVSQAVLGLDRGERVWIALRRQSAGSLDLFTMMSDDIVETLESMSGRSDESLFATFVARIRAWQDFMGKTSGAALAPDVELGLFGELEVLGELIRAGVPASVAAESWKGPLRGLQDFSIGQGALEVKSTLSNNGFPAIFGSLEQLDDSLIRPIFVVGVRLAQSNSGRSLPDQVGAVRELSREDPVALSILNSRLLHIGYHDHVSTMYTRRFLTAGTILLRVSDQFPKLTKSNVPNAIRKVQYEIDLDLILTDAMDFPGVLIELGAIL